MKFKKMPLIDQARIMNPKLDILEQARKYSEEAADYINNYMARLYATRDAERDAVLKEIAQRKEQQQTEIHQFHKDEIAPFCNATEKHDEKCMGESQINHNEHSS